jgi:hypothetical protein
MMKTQKKYIRLPGKHKDLIGNYFHLWRAHDHLLSVSYRFGDEYYKRFYYKDIQTIIIHKTVMGKVQNGIMGGMTVLFGIMAFFTGDIGAVVFGILAFATTSLLLTNIIFHGPTCECHIQTAVQKEKLKSLKFLKKAIKAADIIKEQIEQAQGVISGQELNTAFNVAASKETTVNIDEAASLPLHSNIHQALFILLLLLGMCVAYSFLHQTLVVSFIETLLGLGTSVIMVIALVRQYQIRIASNVRVITWVTLGYTCGYLACGYIIFIFLLIKNPTLANNQWELFKTLSALSPLSHPLLTGIGIFTISGALILGISGLFLLKRS